MFLAAIYPLSERSAVNLMGKVNTGNITGYEEQSTFDSIGGLENDIDQETNFVDDQVIFYSLHLLLFLILFINLFNYFIDGIRRK